MIHTDPIVKMDQCHLDLIYGMLVSHKPKKVLELGMGSGIATDVILKAFEYNGIPLDLTCVDNWLDWNFLKPKEISSYETKGVKVITSAEKDFVYSCKDHFDFIVSDADHDHAQEWFQQSFSLLAPGGIIIYHDVTNPDFANLYSLFQSARAEHLSHFLFNTSSRHEEKCERGLLVIQKTNEYVRPAAVSLKYHAKSLLKYLRSFFAK